MLGVAWFFTISIPSLMPAPPVQKSPAPEPHSGRPSEAKPAPIISASPQSEKQVQDLQKQASQALKLDIEFRDPLKDSRRGPVMVVIPGGRFQMGSPVTESERKNDEPPHEVEVAVFAISKYEVTFEDYDRFAEATGREKPSDEGWGRGRRPVINVTWNDAVAYAQWLSQQTGQTYRLLTEAEWEYACRAGTTTPFYFGETISTDQANYDGNYSYGNGRKGIDRQRTVEVGQFPANAWGLHDMHGNVWEWTCSIYDQDYGGSEQRCAEPGMRRPRVLRGGAWRLKPLWLRCAARYDRYPGGRYPGGGVRLARTL
jgi:formylglycine-generating enzyme required for sulfatase activity